VLVSTWLVASFSSLLGAGWCLVVAVFQVGNASRAFCVCGVVGVDETKASCGLFGFIGCKGFAGQILFVFWL